MEGQLSLKFAITSNQRFLVYNFWLKDNVKANNFTIDKNKHSKSSNLLTNLFKIENGTGEMKATPTLPPG